MKAKYLVLGVFMFLGACSSIPKGYKKVSSDNKFVSELLVMQNKCFINSNPGFDAVFSAPGMSGASLEGVWREEYLQFLTESVALTGETIFSLSFKENKLEKQHFNSAFATSKEELKEFVDVLSGLGSKNIRSLLCGSLLYKTDYYFLLNNSSDMLENADLISENKINIDGRTISVNSHITLSDRITIRSVVSGGLFVGKVGEIIWEGTRDAGKPIKITIKSKGSKNSMNLAFYEFN